MSEFTTAKGNKCYIEKGMDNDCRWGIVVYNGNNKAVKRKEYRSAWEMDGEYPSIVQWAMMSL